MDKINIFANGDNQEKPPPRKCPRCESDNTKFCYYNNYSVSQPRYSCKNCHRFWTHGGALRNIPIGGSSRKAKRPKVKENTNFVGSVGASSSSVGNHVGFLPSIHMDGDMITNVPSIESFPLVDPLDFLDRLYEQDFYGVISNDLIGNPLINQSFVGHIDNHNSYGINQTDQPQWNQSFKNTMDINHNTNTSGNGGSDMNMNYNINTSGSNCVVYSCHLEKQGP